MNNMSDRGGDTDGDGPRPAMMTGRDGCCFGTEEGSGREYRLLFGLDLGGWSEEEVSSSPSLSPPVRSFGTAPSWQRRLRWRRWLSRIASERDTVLAGARQAFGPDGEPDGWVLRVFESALDTASGTEAGDWQDLLVAHLRLPPGSGGKGPSMETQVLAWHFLERLERQGKLPSLLFLAVEILSGRPHVRLWEALCRYCCLFHPGEAARFTPFIVERLSPLTEPAAATRKTGWLTLAGILAECPASRDWTFPIRGTFSASLALETSADVFPALLNYALLAEAGGQAADRLGFTCGPDFSCTPLALEVSGEIQDASRDAGRDWFGRHER